MAIVSRQGSAGVAHVLADSFEPRAHAHIANGLFHLFGAAELDAGGPLRLRVAHAVRDALRHQQLEMRTHFGVQVRLDVSVAAQISCEMAKARENRPHEVALIAQAMAAETRCQFSSSVWICRRPAAVSV